MKTLKFDMPDRSQRALKLWIAKNNAVIDADISQTDYLIWLMENLPTVTVRKPDPVLRHCLSQKTASPIKNLSDDQKIILRLIASGLLSPTKEDTALINSIKSKM